MGLLEKIEKQRAKNPKERIISSLKNRREKTDPWIRSLQIHVIAVDIAESKLNPDDLSEATDAEKQELKKIFEKWAET
jgi:hypothetical protein